MHHLLKSLALAGLVIFAGYGLYAAEISDLSTTDASNTARFPENMAPSALNNAARAVEGYLARYYNDINGSISSYGSGNAIRITSNRTISSLVDGLAFTVKVTAANSGSTTFQVGTNTAKTLYKNHNEALAADDLEQDQIITVVYSLRDDAFQIVGGSKGSTPSAGDGVAVSGSTVSVRVSNGLVISGNAITLPITTGLGLEISGARLALDFNSMTATEITSNDILAIFDSSAQTTRKVTPGQIIQNTFNLSTATPVGTDVVPFIDVSDGNQPKRATVSAMASAMGAGWTLGTEQASTSGTAIDFTGIPAGTKRITVMFEGVSLSGSDDILIQLGDVDGIESTGYVSTGATYATTPTVDIGSSTAGFIIRAAGGAYIFSGNYEFTLKDSANFTWTGSFAMKANTATLANGGGDKSLSKELSQIRITRTGTDTFDAGSINIQYQ